MQSRERGVTLLETLISLGLISIFTLVLAPTLRVSNSINRRLSMKSLVDRENVRILNMIERSIRNSSRVLEEYEGRKFIKDGVGVLEENGTLIFTIGEGVLSNCTDEGNALFLEYARSNGVRIENSIILYQFLNGKLFVTEGKVVNGIIKVVIYDEIFEGIWGKFKKLDSGIVIEYEILGKNSDIREKVKGYESFDLY